LGRLCRCNFDVVRSAVPAEDGRRLIAAADALPGAPVGFRAVAGPDAARERPGRLAAMFRQAMARPPRRGRKGRRPCWRDRARGSLHGPLREAAKRPRATGRRRQALGIFFACLPFGNGKGLRSRPGAPVEAQGVRSGRRGRGAGPAGVRVQGDGGLRAFELAADLSEAPRAAELAPPPVQAADAAERDTGRCPARLPVAQRLDAHVVPVRAEAPPDRPELSAAPTSRGASPRRSSTPRARKAPPPRLAQPHRRPAAAMSQPDSPVAGRAVPIRMSTPSC